MLYLSRRGGGAFVYLGLLIIDIVFVAWVVLFIKITWAYLSLPLYLPQGGSMFTTLVETYLMRLLCVVIVLGVPPLVYAYGKSA